MASFSDIGRFICIAVLVLLRLLLLLKGADDSTGPHRKRSPSFDFAKLCFIFTYIFAFGVLFIQSLRRQTFDPPPISIVVITGVVTLDLETLPENEPRLPQKFHLSCWLLLSVFECYSSLVVERSLATWVDIMLATSSTLRMASSVVLATSSLGPLSDRPEPRPVEPNIIADDIREAGGLNIWVTKCFVLLPYVWPNQFWARTCYCIKIAVELAQKVIQFYRPGQMALFLNCVGTKQPCKNELVWFICLQAIDSDLALDTFKHLLQDRMTMARNSAFRKGIFDILMHQDTDFHNRNTHTDIDTAIDNAATRLPELFDTFIYDAPLNALSIILVTYQMYSQFGSFIVSLLVLVFILRICSERRWIADSDKPYQRWSKPYYEQARQRREGLRAWETVNIHNQVENMVRRYEDVDNSVAETYESYHFIARWYRWLDSLIFEIGLAVVWMVIYRTNPDNSAITAFYGLCDLLSNSVTYFSKAISTTWESLSKVIALRKLLEQVPKVKSPTKALEWHRGDIQLVDVSFSYGGSLVPVIDNLSMTIKGGDTVAIAGPSGVGKSTIISLLMGQYMPTKGNILIDGQDIALVSKNSRHAVMGAMTQEPHIFNNTASFNIRFGCPDATLDEVKDAARKAGIQHASSEGEC